jgi:hypothetical protein
MSLLGTLFAFGASFLPFFAINRNGRRGLDISDGGGKVTGA